MRAESRLALNGVHTPRALQMPWEWGHESIDYSRAQAYETELKTMYNPDYMPFWKEPVEGLLDRGVEEDWTLKCSRAGWSENVILLALRFVVARRPMPVLFLSGQQGSVEDFMEKRIKLGFDLSDETAVKYKRARTREHEIFFEDMDLIARWPANKMAYKQSGYPLILADEVSVFPMYSTDLLRKRTANWAFSTIFGGSSPDPAQRRSSRNDPIFNEFESGDMRYWMMPDPKRKKRLFRFELGGKDVPHGLKWDKRAKRSDDTWDLDRVARSAHYVTPAGTKIFNKDRMRIVRAGKWVVTNKKGVPGRRSRHLNSFYVPFKTGDFGALAVGFLEAKRRGPLFLRTWIYEELAERWEDDIQTTDDNVIYARSESYKKGEKLSECREYKDVYIGRNKATLVTVDVQKAHFWVLAREWMDGGDSGLVDFDYKITIEEIEAFGDKYGAHRIAIDCGYPQRQGEVYEYCYNFAAWPLMGSDRLEMWYKQQAIDPFEGKRGQGVSSIIRYMFNVNVYKAILCDMMRGEDPRRWAVYKGVEHEYVVQAASEERVDGVWQTKPGHSQNHLADCETMQLVLANILGLYHFDVMRRVG